MSLAIRTDATDRADIGRMIDTIVKKWGKLTDRRQQCGNGPVGRRGGHHRRDLAQDHEAQPRRRPVLFPGRGRGDEAEFVRENRQHGIHVRPYRQYAAESGSVQRVQGGVLHLTRSLAAEWAQYGIRVNSISPGYTKTSLVDNLIATPEGKKMADAWIPMIPMRRMAEVTDIQGAVVYLASEASDYMTGSDMIIDGGYCVW